MLVRGCYQVDPRDTTLVRHMSLTNHISDPSRKSKASNGRTKTYLLQGLKAKHKIMVKSIIFNSFNLFINNMFNSLDYSGILSNIDSYFSISYLMIWIKLFPLHMVKPLAFHGKVLCCPKAKKSKKI